MDDFVSIAFFDLNKGLKTRCGHCHGPLLDVANAIKTKTSGPMILCKKCISNFSLMRSLGGSIQAQFIKQFDGNWRKVIDRS